MSKTETISTREFAAIVGFPHGNIFKVVKGMVERGELKLRVSHYQNKPNGKKFDEYHLTPNQANLLNGRLKPQHQHVWVQYVQSSGQRGEADNALATHCSQPTVVSVPSVSVSNPVSAGVTRIVSPVDDELTMSSLEIAALTRKRHADVMRDIRNMQEELENSTERSFASSYKDASGRTLPCYALPRRETDILLTGYSVQLRAKVIDRWRELEAEVAKPAPANLSDPAALRGLLLGYTEKVMELEHQVGIQAGKIEEDKPKVEFHDAVVVAENTHTMKQVADILGVGRNVLLKYLRYHGILIDGGKNHNLPYQPHKDAGRFVVGEEPYKHPYTGKIMLGAVVAVTGRGLIWIREHVAKNGGVKAA